jgi:hypothetical protein
VIKDDPGPLALKDSPVRDARVDTRPAYTPEATASSDPAVAAKARRVSAPLDVSTGGIENGLRRIPIRPLIESDQQTVPRTRTPERTQGTKSVDANDRDACESPESETPPSEHGAWLLKEALGAFFLSRSMGKNSEKFGLQAFKLYRDNLLAEAGDPSDPIEVMLLEQLALSHLNIGRLHAEAATATSNPEHAKIYGSLAIGLTAEFRRTALALKAYRTPDGARQANSSEEQSTVPLDRGVSPGSLGKKGPRHRSGK